MPLYVCGVDGVFDRLKKQVGIKWLFYDLIIKGLILIF